MWKYPEELNLFDKFGKYAKIAGIIFMTLGFIAVFFPVVTSFATVIFVAWLIFIIDWPFTSLYLIGLLVGFSLFFDGLALLMGARFIRKTT